MREIVRFFYLVVVILPLILLTIGPLLVLAALRGIQRIGPIVFNPGERGWSGRVLALLVGLLLWLVVWGGVWALLVQPVLTQIALTPVPTATLTPAGAQGVVTDVSPTLPSATSQPSATLSPTLTSVPSSTPQPLVLATPTDSQSRVTPSPSSTSTPVPVPPTPTPVPLTAVPTVTAMPLPSPTPVATLSPDEAAQVIAVVEAANESLRTAVAQPSIGNLAALETLWRGEALANAQAFSQDLYQRYLHPLEVTFVYLTPPVVFEGASSDTVIVISTEAWTYTGPRTSHNERLEFTYTLTRQEANWVITGYSYRYAPPSSQIGTELNGALAVSSTLGVTTSTVITSTGQ